MPTNITDNIWIYLYRNLHDETLGYLYKTQSMLYLGMKQMPDQMAKDWINDFIAAKWDQMYEVQPVINNPETWSLEGAYGRTFVYTCFAHYCADRYKSKPERDDRETIRAKQEMLEQIPADIKTLERKLDAKKILMLITLHATEEESTIMLWRIGTITDVEACAELDCSLRTLYRKFEDFKTRMRDLIGDS